MSRIITSSIIALLLIIALAGGYFYYQHYKNKNQKPENAIPADAAFFIKGPLNSAFDDLKKTVYWKSLDKSELFKDLKSNIVLFDKIRNEYKKEDDIFNVDDMTLSFHVTGQSSFDLLFVIPIKEISFKKAWDILKQKSLATPSENERKYEGQTFFELNTEGEKIFTYTISNNLFIGSFTPFLVEDAVRQLKVGKPFGNSEAFKNTSDEIASDSSKYSFFINYPNFQKFSSLFANEISKLKTLELDNWADWTGTELQFLSNRIVANGYIKNTDGRKISASLLNQKPTAFKALEALPTNTSAFQVFSLSNLSEWQTNYNSNAQSNNLVSNYKQNLKKFEAAVRVPVGTKFLELLTDHLTVCITEPAGKSYDNNILAFFTLKEPKKGALSLKAFSLIDNPGKKKLPIENFRNHQIANIPIDGLLPAIFGNNYSQFKNFFYTIHNNYLVVANQPSSIRAYIENISDKQALGKSDSWKEVSNTWLTNFNYGMTLIFPAANSLGKIILGNEWAYIADERQSITSDVKAFVYQVSNSDSGLYCHSSIVFSEKKIAGGTNLLWTFKPDTTLISKYHLVSSETESFILCQDASLQLYLINAEGKTEWKKQLDEKITGNIFNASTNGSKMQFLFTTTGKLFLIDQLGKNIGNYPLKLPAKTESGVLLFDNKFFIQCTNQQLYGYEMQGKPLQGWQFIKTSDEWLSDFEIKHVGDKTFLQAIDKNKTLFVYNLNGNLIIKTKLNDGLLYNSVEPNIKSDSLIVFSASDSSGSIYNYFTNGEVTVKSTAFSGKAKDHFLITDEKGMASKYIYAANDMVYLTDKDGKTINTYKSKNNIESVSQLKRNNKTFIVLKNSDNTITLLNEKLQLVKGFPVSGHTISINDDASRVLIQENDVAKFYELN